MTKEASALKWWRGSKSDLNEPSDCIRQAGFWLLIPDRTAPNKLSCFAWPRKQLAAMGTDTENQIGRLEL